MNIFGETKKKETSHVFQLENENGLKLQVTDYGATIVSILLKDKNGEQKDIVLGYDSVTDYEKNGYFFGATIGRNANRIAHASCVLDAKEYQLENNDNGNNLHNGSHGFHSVIWKVESQTKQAIVFSYYSKDMEQDLPGNMKVTVTYTVTQENEICVDYAAVSDKTTIANLTNHTYFNLNGHESGSIENHTLTLLADAYTPVIDEKAIPTGEIVPVSKTPMDFTTGKRIGTDIGVDDMQLKYAGGYDHNFVLAKEHGNMKLAAKVVGDQTNLTMELYTDCPGIQFYSGNFIQKHAGKSNQTYDFRHGFCLEPQFYPNAANEPKFASPILKANEPYVSHIKYVFC